MNRLDLDSLDSHDDIDVKGLIIKYFRFWPWFVFSIILSLTYGYYIFQSASKIYYTESKIKILDDSEGLKLPTEAFVFNRSNINLENEIHILNSSVILHRVVKKLNLNVEFYEEGLVRTARREKLPFFTELKFDKSLDKVTGNYFIFIEKNQFKIRKGEDETMTTILDFNSLIVDILIFLV